MALRAGYIGLRCEAVVVVMELGIPLGVYSELSQLAAVECRSKSINVLGRCTFNSQLRTGTDKGNLTV